MEVKNLRTRIYVTVIEVVPLMEVLFDPTDIAVIKD